MATNIHHYESEEASEIERVAIWAAYKGFDDILRSSVLKLQSLHEGGQTGSPSFSSAISPELQSRIEFFGIRKSVEMLRPRETISAELIDLLGLYDELMSKWALSADRNGQLPELQWTTIRYKIILQIGLCQLKARLGMDSRTDALVRPDALELPDEFDAVAYEESLTELLSSNAYYDRTASTVASKAERTSADILKHALMDVVSGGLTAPAPAAAAPAPKGAKSKGKTTAPTPAQNPVGASLNRYRLFFLLNGNTLASMCREVLEFMHDVESKVLPIPTLAGSAAQPQVAIAPALSSASAAASSSSKAPTPSRGPEKDWTAEDKKAKGPYATPTLKPQSQIQSQLPSLSQSQLMTQVASPANAAPPSPAPVAPKAAIAAEPPPKVIRSTRSAATVTSASKGATKRPPVTEAYTQLSDVEELSHEEEEEEEEEEHVPMKRQTRSSASKVVVDNSEVIDNLRAAKEEFARVMASKDPLLAALAASRAPILSKAAPTSASAPAPVPVSVPAPSGRVTRSALRVDETSSSPIPRSEAVSTKVTSHAPPSATKKAAVSSPKKSLHATRKSAEKIDFEESDIETISDTGATSPKIGLKNKKNETITFVKSKFPRTLESAPPTPPPSAAAHAGAGASGHSALPKGRVPWSVAEEAALIAGIQRHGVGYWKEILDDPELGPVFRGRTNVQLKDKHRNLVNAGTLDAHVPRK